MTVYLLIAAALIAAALLPYDLVKRAVEGSVAYQGLYKGRWKDDVKELFPPESPAQAPEDTPVKV